MGMVAQAWAVGKHHDTGAGGIWALRDVTLEMRGGAFLAVMGPSGSGKSTLLHLLGALDDPTEGTLSIGGRSLSELDHDQLATVRRDRLGIVFQSFNLISVLN